MTVKNYQNVPSNAIDSIIIDNDTNKVTLKYKSSDRTYTYSSENAAEFDTQLLAEFDSEDISVGRLVNQSISNGMLQLITD